MRLAWNKLELKLKILGCQMALQHTEYIDTSKKDLVWFGQFLSDLYQLSTPDYEPYLKDRKVVSFVEDLNEVLSGSEYFSEETIVPIIETLLKGEVPTEHLNRCNSLANDLSNYLEN